MAAFEAENARWLPDYALFMALKRRFGMKSWTEWPDEGARLHTPEAVTQLLADSRLPGMKVLEFAFDSRDTSSYLPHSYGENCVCYTGTHDNAPLALWRTEADREDVAFAAQYLGLN